MTLTNQTHNPKTSGETTDYFKKQFNKGGFCAVCGEGVEPILNNDIESFGLCAFGGKHYGNDKTYTKFIDSQT